MNVIGISAWQEYVDCPALIREGIDGIILKIGERSSLDEMFIEHINNAVDYGLPYGGAPINSADSSVQEVTNVRG